ncbi:MAG: DNA-processing protein DprA [Myxococcales bacterium]|nr:DNA-protecting protein DprA [Polyangiaceae bacterium]MDW8250715.1 DNA-processing protein DprA [Myxococcales bacterium]
MLSRKIERGDPTYPSALLLLKPPPPALWLRGELPSGRAVAVVGTRTPSPEGSRFTFDLASSLAKAGWVVWSGGAFGIDLQAHEGALAAGGFTVLVAGGGLDRPYPKDLAPLWPRVQRQGALLAVVPDDHAPRRWTFFARNAVLAALTEALVLVECPVRSGARNAAAVARALGHPVWVGAQTPWSPFVTTVREELRLGARLLLHPDDLLASLGSPSAPPPASPLLVPRSADPFRRAQLSLPGAPPSLEPLQQRILEAVRSGNTHLDMLCEALGESPPEILRQATLLQLEGLLGESQEGFFVPSRGVGA